MTISVDRPTLSAFAVWQSATWAEYERLRDDPTIEKVQLFFNHNALLVENMGGEGINHAKVRELFSMIIFSFWSSIFPDQPLTSIGGCLLEKKGSKLPRPI